MREHQSEIFFKIDELAKQSIMLHNDYNKLAKQSIMLHNDYNKLAKQIPSCGVHISC